MTTDTTIVKPTAPLFDDARLAIAGFLARYSGSTRTSYATDLRQFFTWCAQCDLEVFAAKRGHIELYARTMEERGLSRATIGRRLSTVAGFYRFAVIDGAIEHSPAEYVRRPKIDTESTTLGLDRMELGAFIAQGSAGSVVDQALGCLLGLLGLRISEALHIDIEHLGIQRGHRTITVLGKGSKLAVIPLPPRVARAVDLAAGERTSGPLLLGRSGDRLNRQAATRIVVRLGQAGRRKQAHLPPLAEAQLHHRCAGRRGPSPRCPDRRPPRRPPDHHPVRPGTKQPGPTRQLHRHRVHRRRVVGIERRQPLVELDWPGAASPAARRDDQRTSTFPP